MSRNGIFRDENGVTTTSMVLSLLITISLVFTSAQVYRICSASAEVQDIADAAALAAENQVGEFMIVARFCDAVVLSLSLTAIAVTGLGLAALCTPLTAAASEGLLKAGADLFKSRDEFARKASSVLGKLQEALPFFAAAAAAGVAQANNGGSDGSNYLAVGLLVPCKGEPIEVDTDDNSDELLDEIDDQADEIREKAKRAEEAAQEANRSKERAFARDCGDNPSYCMYERAASLAGLSGGRNPLYSSVDLWSFSVALNRAKAYYSTRLANEQPANWSIEEQARSALRQHFYQYAVEELRGAYVRESADSFEANIPHLPSNTAEMTTTGLYTDRIYPITEMDGEPVMHAWMGCPEIAGHEVIELESIAYMDSASLPTCPTCGFTVSSMGRVAAASTSIPNGFEYHYEAVADEAALYEKARHEADVPKSEVKSQVGGLFEKLIEVAKQTVGKRIEPSPPGRYGAIAFVVNTGSTSTAGGFASGFVSAGTLGPRAAISSATLVDEGSDEGRTVISSMLDGLREDGGVAAGVAGVVLDAWSWLLTAYAGGQDAVSGAVKQGLDALPLTGASGLGTWASDKLEELMEGVGLQPAEVGALKPVLVNSSHVASKGDASALSGYMTVKQQVIAHPLMSGDLFSSVLSDAESVAVSQIEDFDGRVEIASIELFGGSGASLPITIPLPPEVKSFGIGAVQGLFESIRAVRAEFGGGRVWE